MPEHIELICFTRLVVASVCGLLIGVERQTRMKGAGLRTHMMVALGSALMTLVSSYGFLPVSGIDGASVDVSRVAASIAAGIGFLGAGVIFVHRGGVVGLTTAAGLWTTTGVGMAIGCGMYVPGVTATALMLAAQVLLRGVERREKLQVTELTIRLADGKGDLPRLHDWLAARGVAVREIDAERQEGGSMQMTLRIALPRHFDKADFLRLQDDIPGVQAVEV